MSAEEPRPESWKITLPCTRAEAEALTIQPDAFPDLDEPPVLNTREADPSRPEEWLLEAYVGQAPDACLLAALKALAPSASVLPSVEAIVAQDWVTISQAGLTPITAGRFFVHTAAHAGQAPHDSIVFRIEAGRAFGTGHHATTAGCIAMLDRLERTGASFANVIDVGTGTGLLAFAALALWPETHALASDIDPISIEVARENAEANDIATGARGGEVVLVSADRLDHPLITSRAPFDLVIANILAQPLIDLAPAIGAVTAAGASLILAGLLDQQAEAVTAAYIADGFAVADRIDTGEWPTLLLRRC